MNFAKSLCAFMMLIALSISNSAQAPETPGQSQEAITASEATGTEKKAEAKKPEQPAPKKKKEFSEAIADNSFLIEEAYNQEKDVMQTITTCAWFKKPSNDVACTVTQEFPWISQKHQISYTAPYSFMDSNRVKGIGDISLNYRYQATGDDSWATIAPRISLLLPSGNRSKGLGSGSAGLQFNLPVSKRISESFAGHFNAGMTFLPHARGETASGNTVKKALTSYNVGGSMIWLAHKRFNAVFEYNENFASEINEFGKVNRFNEHIVNPGVRFAIDMGGLQVVPGISVPTSFSRGQSKTGVFFYLSFEHPFRKQRQR